MTARAEPVLRFDRFPTIHKTQRDADGRLWQIVKIEAPRRGFRYRVPLATADQRRLYDEMRKWGVDRAAALAAVL
jgi:hypothetical protein